MSDVVYSGVHAPLEDVANALIFGSLVGVTSQEEKKDILTPWKEQDRRSREVLARAGVIDPSTRRGMYHRAANPNSPHLNSRDGIARGYRTRTFGMRDDWVADPGAF